MATFQRLGESKSSPSRYVLYQIARLQVNPGHRARILRFRSEILMPGSRSWQIAKECIQALATRASWEPDYSRRTLCRPNPLNTMSTPSTGLAIICLRRALTRTLLPRGRLDVSDAALMAVK